MSEVLTNNAAAAIMFPIAANLADQLGIHPNMMSVAVMLGGSAGWIMPYSYQCNLMVYAAGKYQTKDFIKIGVPYYVSAFSGYDLKVLVTHTHDLVDQASKELGTCEALSEPQPAL
jgi:Na+/H+ antiporter NhaC